jgi:hypothetical protein
VVRVEAAASLVDPENRKAATVTDGICVSLTRGSDGSGSWSIAYFDGMKKRIAFIDGRFRSDPWSILANLNVLTNSPKHVVTRLLSTHIDTEYRNDCSGNRGYEAVD